MYIKWILISLLLWACSEEASGPKVKALATDGSKDIYQGGVRKAWVDINSKTIKPSEVSWHLGAATQSNRISFLSEDSTYKTDTLFFQWDVLPPKVADTVVTIKDEDTTTTITESYRDTIFAIVKGEISEAFVFDVQNILPKIDSIVVGSRVQQQVDSVISLSAYPGQNLTFSVNVSDAFNSDFSATFSWSKEANIKPLASDSGFQFRWIAPDSLSSDTLRFSVLDKSGFGQRDYILKLLTYHETGSAWVASSKDVVKVSSNGQEVFRISNAFQEISSLTINPNSVYIWVTDKGSNKLRRYNLDGELNFSDTSSFSQPTALAIDAESGFLWIADLQRGAKGRLRRYLLSGDSLSSDSTMSGFLGPVTSLDTDPFANDILWFAVPESDQIGLAKDGKLDTLISSTFNRPRHISWDTKGGKVWIADSSKVYLADAAGTTLATISGFEFISSISAGKGGVCVADVRKREVLRFASTISGNITTANGIKTTGYLSPEDVEISNADGSCWVVDSELGIVANIDSTGIERNRLGGLRQPTVLAVHQGVE